MNNGKYKYYAFISYKREDEEWAAWLQHEFEHYRLPSTLNGRSDLPTEFGPVFRDVDELSAGNLPAQIHEALEEDTREDADQGDADLDGREELVGVLDELLGPPCPGVALAGEHLEVRAARRDERDLGHGEEPVEQDQQQDDDYFHGCCVSVYSARR